MAADPRVREAARAANRRWSAGSIAGWAATVLSAAVHPDVSASFGVIAVIAQALAFRAGAVADDPPDPDFRASVIFRPRPLVAVRSGTSASQELFRAARSTNDAAAFLGSAVRAYERAQGAAQYQDRAALLNRLDEGRTYSQAAARALADASGAAPLMRDLGTEVSSGSWLEAMVAEVPADSLLAAYRAGLTNQEIESSLARRPINPRDAFAFVGGDPWTALSTAFSNLEFAEALHGWLANPEQVAGQLWDANTGR